MEKQIYRSADKTADGAQGNTATVYHRQVVQQMQRVQWAQQERQVQEQRAWQVQQEQQAQQAREHQARLEQQEQRAQQERLEQEQRERQERQAQEPQVPQAPAAAQTQQIQQAQLAIQQAQLAMQQAQEAIQQAQLVVPVQQPQEAAQLAQVQQEAPVQQAVPVQPPQQVQVQWVRMAEPEVAVKKKKPAKRPKPGGAGRGAVTKRVPMPEEAEAAVPQRGAALVAKQAAAPTLAEEPAAPKKRNRVLKILSDCLFYSAVVAVLLAAVLLMTNNQAGGNVMGYSAFTVLTGSMQRVYPQGSLVVVQSTAPSAINVGDDITFRVGPQAIVSHRVVEIQENYEDSGQRAFITQGVENPSPDREPVLAGSLLGRVVWGVPVLGSVLAYIKANLWLIAALWGLLLLLSFSIRVFIGESKAEKSTGRAPAKGRSLKMT